MNGFMHGVPGINGESRRLEAADGGAADVMLGRDQGCNHQGPTLLHLDTRGDACVGECVLSLLPHLLQSRLSLPSGETEMGGEGAPLLEVVAEPS